MSADEESFKVKLGRKIKQRRIESEFGVREFALHAGIEHPQLINIENGRVDIRISTLIKIAKGLGVEAKELLDF